MGLFDSILKVAAPVAGGFFGGPAGAALGGALAGAVGGSGASQSGSATSTSQNKLDPRIDGMLFGQNGQPGMLSQYQNMLNQPGGQKAFQQAGSDYLNNYASQDMAAQRNAATGLMNGNAAPTANVSAYAVGNMVNAPNQNNLDLSGAYNNMIYGDAGANPYLNQHLQSAVDLTNAGFQKNQTDLTNNLMRNVMPSIRSNSVLAGQYGGSRQGIAEGNALSDYTNQLTNANLQLGLANSANTTGAQANSFNQGQDRALAAMQGLGAQQYGVASQNAATKNAAEFANVNNVQQANLANQQSQLATNAQNNAAAMGGAGLLGGLNSNAVGATNSDVARASGVNSLLTPYLGSTGSQTTSQPLYQNQAGNILGGALMGSQLFGGSGSSGAGAQPLDGLMKYFNIGPGVIGG